MKNVSMLVWLTQLGLSVAVSPTLFILLALWLKNACGWGTWVLWVGIGLGIYSAIAGFLSSLRTMERMASDGRKESPAAAFNDHE